MDFVEQLRIINPLGKNYTKNKIWPKGAKFHLI